MQRRSSDLTGCFGIANVGCSRIIRRNISQANRNAVLDASDPERSCSAPFFLSSVNHLDEYRSIHSSSLKTLGTST
jgi:hypothetical protein